MSSTAILASDFSDSVSDVNRHRWTLGKMQFVVDALMEAPVAVIVDKGTGHAEVGVILKEAFDGGGDRGPRLAVYRPDIGSTTNFWLPNIGETIIPLDEVITVKGAKWRALEQYRKVKSEATRIARAEHGECEGRAWGKWKATPITRSQVDVTYTPHTGNDAFKDQWGTRWYGRIRVDV